MTDAKQYSVSPERCKGVVAFAGAGSYRAKADFVTAPLLADFLRTKRRQACHATGNFRGSFAARRRPDA